MDELQVWIPAQDASTRVKHKNFRTFSDDKSLLEIKIEQLLSSNIPCRSIFVSSETDKVIPIAEKYNINVIRRGVELLGNEILQRDLFGHFFENTPSSKFVMWVQVTDPLFGEFCQFLDKMGSTNKKSTLVLATKLQKHVFYNNMPLNFQFGDWHQVSQNIEPIIVPRWSTFLHERIELSKVMYHFGYKNEFVLTDLPYIDIDTHADFKLAQNIYESFANAR